MGVEMEAFDPLADLLGRGGLVLFGVPWTTPDFLAGFVSDPDFAATIGGFQLYGSLLIHHVDAVCHAELDSALEVAWDDLHAAVAAGDDLDAHLVAAHVLEGFFHLGLHAFSRS